MMQAADNDFASLRIGDTASFERAICAEDVHIFADLSGDYNPLHTDDAYARTTQFDDRLVHGMFLGALVSRLIGMHLPGTRALLIKESLEFKKPVHIGDAVRVKGTLVRTSPATRIIELNIQMHVGKVLVATGQAQVQVRNE